VKKKEMKVNKERKQGGREERRPEGRTEKGSKENGKIKMEEREIRNKDKKKEVQLHFKQAFVYHDKKLYLC
jgi:hypothetical protein